MEEQEIRKKMSDMEDTLNRWEYLYRVKDNPEVSDEDFDILMKEYKELANIYPQFVTENSPLNKVGSVLVDGFQKVEHKLVMGSLENVYSKQEIIDWVESLGQKLNVPPSSLRFVLEDKFDGISGELVYQNGKLIEASTRGDGNIGDLITENAKMAVNMPCQMKWKKDFTGYIRGEFIIFKKDFEKINEIEKATFKNPRNLVSGTMKSLDSKIVKNRFVFFVPYYFYDKDYKEIDIDNDEDVYLRKLPDEFDRKENGYCTLKGYSQYYSFFMQNRYYGLNVKTIFALIDDAEEEGCDSNYKNRPYPIDGLVLKLEGKGYREILGNSSNCPNWARAYKFKQEKAITKVKGITWQVGREKITPVAELEPVELEGTTVSRATIHNVTQLKRLGVVKGSTVEIEKAAFIIPYIRSCQKNNGEPYIPETCPVCGQPTKIVKIDSEYLICTNEFCKAKLLASCDYAVKVLGIDNIGESLLEKLINADIVKTPLDIMKLSEMKLLYVERMGDKLASKIVKNINKAVVQTLPKIIEFLGIKGVGKLISEKICSIGINSFSEFIDMDYSVLEKIDGIGSFVITSLNDYREKNKDYMKQVADLFILKKMNKTNILEGLKFVITGAAVVDRNVLEKLVKENGGSVSGSVSKNTDVVIIGSKEGENYNSTKKKKAVELGKQIVNEQWLFEKVGYCFENQVVDKVDKPVENQNNKPLTLDDIL